MTDMRVLLDGLLFPESPRWHDGCVYVSDWGSHEVIMVPDDGVGRVVATGSAFPMCFDFLPDNRLLIVDGTRLVVQEPDGSVATYADLTTVSHLGFNDVTVDPRANVFVNNVGFEFGREEPRPGLVAVVTPDGTARQVAGDLMFPNGMVVTDDGATLVVAESYAGRLTAFDIADDGSLSGRRVWAELAGGVLDGICVDDEGAIWYADVPHACCVRVAQGGGCWRRSSWTGLRSRAPSGATRCT